MSGQRYASAPLHTRGKDPWYRCTGGWVGSRAGLNTEARGEIFCISRGSNLDCPVVQSVARHCTDCATRFLFYLVLAIKKNKSDICCNTPRLTLLQSKIVYRILTFRRRGSSVSTVSGYGLDDRAIEFRSPAEAKDFSSSLWVQTGSGAHPSSHLTSTGGPFPGAKARPGSYADHLLPSLVPRSRMSRSYAASHFKCLHGV
jgi:hypothetical protein